MGSSEPQPRSDQLSYAQLQALLKRYPAHVRAGLQTLDAQRYDKIPDALAKRQKQHEPGAAAPAPAPAPLDKNELVALVEWKLKRGTYRPKLAALVAANSAAEVRDATAQAFAAVHKAKAKAQAGGTGNDDDDDDVQAVAGEPLASLTRLKGVGPATASLVLSCYDPVRVPFFSDELFRYAHPVLDWRRKIGYTKKEYGFLLARCAQIRRRLERESGASVSAAELEKAAYVLGKEAAGAAGAAQAEKPMAKKRAAAEAEAPQAEDNTTRPKRSKK